MRAKNLPATAWRWTESPRTCGGQGASLTRPARGAKERAGAAEFAGSHVLVVDDEPSHAELALRTLERFGFIVTLATNVGQALRLLRDALGSQRAIDLLITDLNLAGELGTELVQEALRIDATLAAVVVTAHGSVDSAVEAMRNGAVDYVEKPLRPATLDSVLARALSARQLRLENAALQTRIRERTRELEEANQELQAANVELEAFAYTVSHDVRNPLYAMVGFAELLHSEAPGALNDLQKDYVREIQDGGTRLVQLTHRLLELAQLGCGNLAKVPVNVGAVVTDVMEELRRHNSHRKVETSIGALPDVLGDPTLLRQVFFNLLHNAYKFTAEKREARIEVLGAHEPGWCTYTVRDNGAGFDQCHAASIFADFSRLHPDERFSGTGVGLSVVRRIVERHHGNVIARGEVGKGASIRVCLPC